jgi:hypothetical protein
MRMYMHIHAQILIRAKNPASNAIAEESEEEAREDIRLPPISTGGLSISRESGEGADMSICREDSPAPSSSSSTNLAADLQILHEQNAQLMSTVAALEQANSDLVQQMVILCVCVCVCVCCVFVACRGCMCYMYGCYVYGRIDYV